MTHADRIVAILQRAGVRRLFGMPGGGSNADLIEAAGRAGMPFSLAHTETAAAFMALALGGPAGIDRVHIETYGPGYEIVKEMNPRSPYQAKFSIAYCVAAALAEGRVGLDQFSTDRFGPEGVRVGAIADLLRRTRVTMEDDLTAKYPAAWPARLNVTLADGTVLRGASDFPRGNPENPVSTPELEDKFLSLVASRFGPDTARRALEAVHAVDRAGDMAEVFRNL